MVTIETPRGLIDAIAERLGDAHAEMPYLVTETIATDIAARLVELGFIASTGLTVEPEIGTRVKDSVGVSWVRLDGNAGWQCQEFRIQRRPWHQLRERFGPLAPA